MNTILEKISASSFRPLPFLKNGHMHTIAAHYFPYNPFLKPSQQHTLTLPDGDQLILTENRPSHPRPSRRMVLLVHGLAGSHRSKYLIRLTQQLLIDGYHVFRLDLRGCGAGRGLAKQFYHSGRSEDTRATLAWLKQYYPHQPVTQIGFSLGANITLKMAGEHTIALPNNLDSIIAVSPPLDLYGSVKRLIHPKNKIFNDYFMKALLNSVNHAPLPPLNNIYEFDETYTAPRSGFKNAIDYYTQCSSKMFVNNITLPMLLLYAKDDPVIAKRPFLKLLHKQDALLITESGGHLGWLGYTAPRFACRWMDQTLIQWLNTFDNFLCIPT